MLISFEGAEGVGKTTLIRKLFDYFQQQGKEVVLTREPGGTPLAEQIRSLLLSVSHDEKMSHDTELLLMYAARAQHLEQIILPALAQNKIVLCDRFIDSSLAYQGIARGLGIDEVYHINEFAIDGYMPDATIFLKVSPEIGLARIASRSNKDRLDIEGESFHRLVAKGYDEVVERYQDRIRVINAEQGVEEVFKDTYQLVKELVK